MKQISKKQFWWVSITVISAVWFLSDKAAIHSTPLCRTPSLSLDSSHRKIWKCTLADTVMENFLLTCDLTAGDVANDSGDAVSGQYAYIRITEEQLETITADMLKEFADIVVADSGYNWVSIRSCSDTGICFSDSDITYAEYGELDKYGNIRDAFGIWVRNDEDSYSYFVTMHPHNRPAETE